MGEDAASHAEHGGRRRRGSGGGGGDKRGDFRWGSMQKGSRGGNLFFFF
jgi:hypothetical protein